uniref:Cytokine receptor-like factor 2 n=1 Tax=Phasianus colchicus TaxID=9054 RepID=A0A669Q614_PHACC
MQLVNFKSYYNRFYIPVLHFLVLHIDTVLKVKDFFLSFFLSFFFPLINTKQKIRQEERIWKSHYHPNIHLELIMNVLGKKINLKTDIACFFFLFSLVKPNRPENVTFFWKDDTVTVTCNKPEKGVKCLRLELQYKSKYDRGWQSRTSKCCRVGEQGFDPRKCYSFRVRLKRIVPSCNVVDYSSDWEAETFWMNSTLLGNSCAIFMSCLSNTFFSLCRLQKSVMPTIPEPKYIFTDLFNDHSGNFQVNIPFLANKSMNFAVLFSKGTELCSLMTATGPEVMAWICFREGSSWGLGNGSSLEAGEHGTGSPMHCPKLLEFNTYLHSALRNMFL